MKLELVEEIEFDRAPMYKVSLDGKTIQWFVRKEDAEKLYNLIISNPNVVNTVKNVLKSQEIDLSLEKTN